MIAVRHTDAALHGLPGGETNTDVCLPEVAAGPTITGDPHERSAVEVTRSNSTCVEAVEATTVPVQALSFGVEVAHD